TMERVVAWQWDDVAGASPRPSAVRYRACHPEFAFAIATTVEIPDRRERKTFLGAWYRRSTRPARRSYHERNHFQQDHFAGSVPHAGVIGDRERSAASAYPGDRAAAAHLARRGDRGAVLARSHRVDLAAAE